jgi:hypothetical protein
MGEPESRSKAVRLQSDWEKIGKQLSALGTAQLGAELRVELTKNPKAEIWESSFLTTVVFKKKRTVLKDWPYAIEQLVDIVNDALTRQKATWRFASETRDHQSWIWMAVVPGAEIERAARTNVAERVSDVVGKRRVAVFDSECVDSVADYASLVSILASTTEGVLDGVGVECADDGKERRVVLRLGSFTELAALAGGTDHADLPPLLAAMNRLIERRGDLRRLYEVRQAGWRQEAGVAFASSEEASTLERWGLLVEPSSSALTRSGRETASLAPPSKEGDDPRGPRPTPPASPVLPKRHDARAATRPGRRPRHR